MRVSLFAVVPFGLVGILAVCPWPAGGFQATPAPELAKAATASSLPPPPDDYNFVHPRNVECGEQITDASYKVPLTPAQERRAERIYRNSLVILAHVHCVETWDFEEMHKAGITAVILKVDDDGINLLYGNKRVPIPDSEDWLARGTRAMRRIHELARRPNSVIRIVRNVADLRAAKRDGKVGIILSFEGARPLAGRLENVTHYHKLGMGELQLWWAVPNALKTPDSARFSTFGLDVIREMNRLGIVIDLSHITPAAFAQAMETTRKPVIISHCAVSAVRGKAGNTDAGYSGTDHLNDATIRAMAKNGGTICVHFVTPDYIVARHGTKKATVVDLVDHIAYVRDLVGAAHVSLGADFFPETGWHWVEGAGRMSLVHNVAREMVRRGFTDEEIGQVLGGNLLRVFEHNWHND